MSADIPLTPEAAAVWAAFTNGMEAGEVFACGPSEGLAHALRELANQVVPAIDPPPLMRGPAPREEVIDEIRGEILAIADNIENAITYAEPPTDD